MQKDILDFLSEFAVFLQDHKFAVSESALAHLLRSVEAAGVDITEEDEMLAALSVCLAKTGEQVAKMKALFREFLSKKTIPQRVLYALKDFLIKRLGSLLEHTTKTEERSASYEKKRENHSSVRTTEP